MTARLVYSFGARKAQGDGSDKGLLGGKGAGLMQMTRIGLPVPAGFVVSTECCEQYFKLNRRWPKGLDRQVREALKGLEKLAGKRLGQPGDPLLVSVRSGAALSMPGMMETILNLGLNDRSVEGLARVTKNRRFALDAYRRLISMYGGTAKGVPRERFEQAMADIKVNRTGPRTLRVQEPGSSAEAFARSIPDTDINEPELEELIQRFKQIYDEHTHEAFPQHPREQLVGAITAVFESWMFDKAVTYRRVEKITGLKGTAVNVQQMVFGNMGEDSATGVCFTRDPSTGENVYFGDFLMNAQGEDVVAGIRTPCKLAEMRASYPEIYDQLYAVRAILEAHYTEMQDLEFTIERGKLYMLQCRAGKRNARAAFKIAVDQATKPLLTKAEASRLVNKGYLPRKYAHAALKPLITKEEAIARMTPRQIEQLFYPAIDPSYPLAELEKRLLARGIDAVPGAAKGQVVFSAADAEREASNKNKVILVRKETSPDDVGGMHAAQGVLTATGGPTSHAAVVARGWGKSCIVGCGSLHIDYEHGQMSVNGKIVRQGDWITLDGSEGAVYEGGEIPLIEPEFPTEYHTLMGWADRIRRLKVRTNADRPVDSQRAVELGAQGIGLCRTEHMFFKPEERLVTMQQMIMAETEPERRAALDKLLPFQKKDFIGIFEAMNKLPVTIRLVDPPLHEFLPKTPEERARLGEVSGVPIERIEQRAEQLHESNPMLGHRGCRLCITYPEILEMQVRAVMEAAVDCKRRGFVVLPEIMIPLSIDAKELAILGQRTRAVADQVLRDAGVKINYLVGTMVETPRAALTAAKIAEVMEFFSFGTNDLTQMTMAVSRDDAGRFLPAYCDASGAAVFAHDPFQILDQEGVGMLVAWAILEGRRARPKLKIGICGEHGGELHSVKFCHRVGMDYVSCSPLRVPIARLAAAQAVIEEKTANKRTGKPAAKRRVKPKARASKR